MENRTRVFAAVGLTVTMFLLVQLGALALVDPFVSAGYQQVEDPSDPTNSFLYLVVILVATGGILLVVRLGVEGVLKAFVMLTSGLLSWYVLSVVVPAVVPGAVGGWLALGLAGAIVVALWVYPEWYVIDAAGVLMAAGGAALFGISFGPLPALLLLSVLAVYDAISVYGTEHMLTLAESVTDLKLPLVLVVPLSLSYSFLGDDPMGAESEGPRDAFFIGLGDTVIPTVLVASAAFFVEAPSLGVPGVALTLPALLAMLGTLAGLAGLLWMVAKGRAHAGLPLLNGGAIVGYLIGAILAGVPLVDAIGLGPYL
jgi:presenilin-like A22 family membrane protease